MRRLLAFCLSFAFFPAGAAPAPDLWARWQANNPESERTVDHRAWDDFLSRHLGEADGVAVLDYAGIGAADRRALKDYLGALSAVSVGELNRDEQRAFWINLYNAKTVELVLDSWPVESIRDISSGFLSFGPWDEKVLTVEGEAVSLNDIEHRILRPIWRDARLHYAVNCASIGCPNLAAVAFTADNTEALLDSGARAYVNHPRGVRLVDGELWVSSIYVWFRVDFGGDEAGVIRHLKRYADADLRAGLEMVSSIGGDGYDWSINRKP